MLDLNNLPIAGNAKVEVFYANSTVVGSQAKWQTWQKPRGVSSVYIFALGGGGGGGGGSTTIGGTAGSSGAKCTVLYNANDLPDTLYVAVGNGGAGQPSGSTAATAAVETYVSVAPNTTANNLVAIALGATAASGGTVSSISSAPIAGLGLIPLVASTGNISIAGSSNVPTLLQANTVTGASGNGTTATITFANTVSIMYSIGQQITIAGVNPAGYNGTYTITSVGSTSVSYANATTAAWVSGGTVQGQKAYAAVGTSILGLTTGGMGGVVNVTAASAGYSGADVYNPSINTTVSGLYGSYPCLGGSGGSSGTSNGADGCNGYQIPNTLLFYGGAGGGASGSTSGTGGKGGSGAYGCGGGGGGAGVTAGGVGGKGGDGLVIMVAV